MGLWLLRGQGVVATTQPLHTTMDSIASNTTIISEGAPVPHENSLPRKPRADSDPTTGIFGIIMWASGLAAFGVQGAHLPPFRRKKPENDQERTATIRIWAGETAPGQSPYGLTNASLPGDDNLEGLMPSVRLRSNYGVKLCDTKQGDAKKREDYIHEGRTVSIDCVLDDNVQGQPRYLDVAGAVTNKDTSLCVSMSFLYSMSHLTLTQPW